MNAERFPRTERAFARAVSIPIYPVMEEEDVARVSAALIDYGKAQSRKPVRF